MEQIIAYCLKTKKKETLLEGVIYRTPRGGYICKGVTEDGNKVSVIMSKETAEDAVESNLAKNEF